MEIHNKLRMMREIRQWSQEEMAEKMNMSLSGYSKIERGETKLHLNKLEQIAQIFDMDLIELITTNEKGLFFFMSGNSDCTSTYYSGNESLVTENEKLKLLISHKDEMLLQKEKEIEMLREMLSLIKGSK